MSDDFIKLSFPGLDEMIRTLERVKGRDFCEKVDQRILKRSGERIEAEMEKRIPRSKDPFSSGRWRKGYGHVRPEDGHAKDNIPTSPVRRSYDNLIINVGWRLSDTSPYFYTKFINWGTVQMPPKPFLEPSYDAAEGDIREIIDEEYKNALRNEGIDTD